MWENLQKPATQGKFCRRRTAARTTRVCSCRTSHPGTDDDDDDDDDDFFSHPQPLNISRGNCQFAWKIWLETVASQIDILTQRDKVRILAPRDVLGAGLSVKHKVRGILDTQG